MSQFRIIVVGLGTQGMKRRRVAKDDFVASVDPIHQEADYDNIEEIPLDSYDAALLCVPDKPKIGLLTYLLKNKKHALVEKPLWSESSEELESLQRLANDNATICYTAYNHRFEPHFINMKKLIESGDLGRIYSCRMFYGNGTASLVKASQWRDQGAGVLPDLGSHLLDTARFWFGDLTSQFDLVSSNNFENVAPDHVVLLSQSERFRLELEMTLLMWRNHFTCDILAEEGSAHIESLCKWGPSKFTKRMRIKPSGRPTEEVLTLVQEDPTWEAEYAFFKNLCRSTAGSSFDNDIWLNSTIGKLSNQACI